MRWKYEELINSLKLQNIVRLSGNMPHDLVFNELDTSHVFVLISEENFSVAAVKAMSRGLPVVVSESTGIPELISDGIQGFVIRDTKRMDPKHVASVLKKFVSDPQIISEMSVTALQTSKRSTWEENAKNFFQIIKNILGAKL